MYALFFISVLILKWAIGLFRQHVNEKKTDRNHTYDKRIPYPFTQHYTV